MLLEDKQVYWNSASIHKNFNITNHSKLYNFEFNFYLTF